MGFISKCDKLNYSLCCSGSFLC